MGFSPAFVNSLQPFTVFAFRFIRAFAALMLFATSVSFLPMSISLKMSCDLAFRHLPFVCSLTTDE